MVKDYLAFGCDNLHQGKQGDGSSASSHSRSSHNLQIQMPAPVPQDYSRSILRLVKGNAGNARQSARWKDFFRRIQDLAKRINRQ